MLGQGVRERAGKPPPLLLWPGRSMPLLRKRPSTPPLLVPPASSSPPIAEARCSRGAPAHPRASSSPPPLTPSSPPIAGGAPRPRAAARHPGGRGGARRHDARARSRTRGAGETRGGMSLMMGGETTFVEMSSDGRCGQSAWPCTLPSLPSPLPRARRPPRRRRRCGRWTPSKATTRRAIAPTLTSRAERARGRRLPATRRRRLRRSAAVRGRAWLLRRCGGTPPPSPPFYDGPLLSTPPRCRCPSPRRASARPGPSSPRSTHGQSGDRGKRRGLPHIPLLPLPSPSSNDAASSRGPAARRPSPRRAATSTTCGASQLCVFRRWEGRDCRSHTGGEGLSRGQLGPLSFPLPAGPVGGEGRPHRVRRRA